MKNFNEGDVNRSSIGRFASKNVQPPSAGFGTLGASATPNAAFHGDDEEATEAFLAVDTGHLTDAELIELADEGNSIATRAAVATSGYPGAGVRASRDPDPSIRALAVGAWDLQAEDHVRLSQDSEAQRAYTVLTSD